MYVCINAPTWEEGGRGLRLPHLMHSQPHTPTIPCNGGVTAIRAIFTLSERKCLLLNAPIKKPLSLSSAHVGHSPLHLQHPPKTVHLLMKTRPMLTPMYVCMYIKLPFSFFYLHTILPRWVLTLYQYHYQIVLCHSFFFQLQRAAFSAAFYKLICLCLPF